MLKMTEDRKKVIFTYAECSMNAEKASRILFMAPESVRYHLRATHEVTGLDPRNFWDLVKLIKNINDGAYAPEPKKNTCKACGTAYEARSASKYCPSCLKARRTETAKEREIWNIGAAARRKGGVDNGA